MLGRRSKNVMTNSDAPDLASYRHVMLPSAGAQEFVYQKPVTWPLYTFWGDGIKTREQFNVLQTFPQVRVVFANTKAPIYGAGVPAGSTEFQALLDETDDSNYE